MEGKRRKMAGMAGRYERERKREREKMKLRDRANVAVAWPAKRLARVHERLIMMFIPLFISWYIEAHFDEQESYTPH